MYVKLYHYGLNNAGILYMYTAVHVQCTCMNKMFWLGGWHCVFQGCDSQARAHITSLEEENAHLQASIERMGSLIAILERDKEELANEVVITKATVSVLHVLYVQCTDVHVQTVYVVG